MMIISWIDYMTYKLRFFCLYFLRCQCSILHLKIIKLTLSTKVRRPKEKKCHDTHLIFYHTQRKLYCHSFSSLTSLLKSKHYSQFLTLVHLTNKQMSFHKYARQWNILIVVLTMKNVACIYGNHMMRICSNRKQEVLANHYDTKKWNRLKHFLFTEKEIYPVHVWLFHPNRTSNHMKKLVRHMQVSYNSVHRWPMKKNAYICVA